MVEHRGTEAQRPFPAVRESLNPVSFMRRAAVVYRDRPAIIDDGITRTYSELWSRCCGLAGGLRALGTEEGDRVAVLAPNTALMLEAHTGIPAAGAVIVALNHRLTAADLEAILAHSGSRILLVDHELEQLGRAAVAGLSSNCDVIVAAGPDSPYETMVRRGPELDAPIEDETGLIALNYTSGTTGRPKGVMYQPRGAYLQALAMAVHTKMGPDSRFLWTLPMFHCNGWCFTWAVTAVGATHVGMRRVTPAAIWAAITDSEVTHFNAAPTVLGDLLEGVPEPAPRPGRPIRVATGGAPPMPTLLARLSEFGIEVTHLYGLTETYGPSVICEWMPEWSGLPAADQAALKARQGVPNIITGGVRVVDTAGRDVPADATTLGEILISGNNVTAGYFNDPEATAAAFLEGWFRTGDLGVMHADCRVELRDRAKDVIISGGENIASVEVERAIATHPSVIEVAVVAMPHQRFGEVPVAFVSCRDDAVVGEADITAHARSSLAGFKVPKRVVFGELPKNATGKIQKFVLRERAAGLARSRPEQ